MRWQSSTPPSRWTIGEIDLRTIGPIVIGSTKCPSPTSKWKMRTPASMTVSICSPSTREVRRVERRLDLGGAHPFVPAHRRIFSAAEAAEVFLARHATLSLRLHLEQLEPAGGQLRLACSRNCAPHGERSAVDDPAGADVRRESADLVDESSRPVDPSRARGRPRSASPHRSPRRQAADETPALRARRSGAPLRALRPWRRPTRRRRPARSGTPAAPQSGLHRAPRSCGGSSRRSRRRRP